MLGPAPALAADEVHLWLASLQPPAERLSALAATLTVDERERAARLRFPEHRDRFIAGRGLLRELLGAYLDEPAALLRFSQGPRGKPALVDQPAEPPVNIDLPPLKKGGQGGFCTGYKTQIPTHPPLLKGGIEQLQTPLHFNLSHSGDRVLYAIARREVGVDLEAMERRLDYTAVAERICTPREWAAFQALPAAQAREIFFACWTRKEAVAKATGDGLAGGLGKLDLCFQNSDWLRQRAGRVDAAGQEWSVLNVPIESGWVAALAAPGVDWRWRGWR
jgi:4'-phosphopantetheinyl transferase